MSLAHHVLVTTRGWAANSRSECVRLRAEIDQCKQEIALLREEMRIKDARTHGRYASCPTPPLSANRTARHSRTTGGTRLVAGPNRPRLSAHHRDHCLLDEAAR